MPGMKPDVKYEINFNIKQGLGCFQLNPCFFGGARRNRTDDLYNAIVALSQLSYGPKLVLFSRYYRGAPREMPGFRGGHFMNAYAPRQVLFFTSAV